MIKRMTKEQRTERKCLVCDELFTPKKGVIKGIYCSLECSRKANGYKIARSNLGVYSEITTPEEAKINYEEWIGKGDYDFE